MRPSTVRVEDGYVLHITPCDQCNDGRVEVCRHGMNCPCSDTWMQDCENCDGAGEQVDKDCDCLECRRVAEGLVKVGRA